MNTWLMFHLYKKSKTYREIEKELETTDRCTMISLNEKPIVYLITSTDTLSKMTFYIFVNYAEAYLLK